MIKIKLYTKKSSISSSLPFKKIVSLGCLVSALTFLTACGTKGIDPESHEPVKLVKLSQNVNILTPVLKTSLPGKSKLSHLKQLQVGFDGSKVIAASGDGVLTGFNKSGQRLWSIDLGDEIVGGVSVDNKTQSAIVTTKSAEVMAVSLDNGSLKWKAILSGTVLSPALVHNNRVVLVGNNGIVYGLSLQTGDTIWQYATQTPSISLRGSAKPTLLDSQTVLVASADGRLHALNIETGISNWSRRVGVPSGASEIQRMTDIDGVPVVDKNQLFAVSYSGQLMGIDLMNLQINFLQEAKSKNSLAVTGDTVVTTTLDGSVKAFNRNDGSLVWESTDLAYRNLSNPVVVGDYIAIGDLAGVIHLFSAIDGKIVSRVQVKGSVNNLTVQDDYLLTQTTSGNVSIWKF